MKAIEVLSLTKKYRAVAALADVSFDLDEGDALALVGPNGAGKTTLLRILATLLKPTAGYARVMGLDGRFQASRIRRSVGYMPDLPGIEEDLTVEEYLEFFAGLHGLGGEARKATVGSLLALLDLDGLRDQTCGALSRGMQQRVALARTLVHNPSVLLLDEPAANLDPRARIEIREVLKECRRMGKTILISSHILMELAELCNKILLIDHGKLVHCGSIAELAGRFRSGRRIEVQAGGDAARLGAALRAEAGVEEVAETDGRLRVRLKAEVEDYSFIVRRAVQEGVPILGLREEEPGLEEIFLRLTGRKEGP